MNMKGIKKEKTGEHRSYVRNVSSCEGCKKTFVPFTVLRQLLLFNPSLRWFAQEICVLFCIAVLLFRLMLYTVTHGKLNCLLSLADWSNNSDDVKCYRQSD